MGAPTPNCGGEQAQWRAVLGTGTAGQRKPWEGALGPEQPGEGWPGGEGGLGPEWHLLPAAAGGLLEGTAGRVGPSGPGTAGEGGSLLRAVGWELLWDGRA